MEFLQNVSRASWKEAMRVISRILELTLPIQELTLLALLFIVLLPVIVLRILELWPLVRFTDPGGHDAQQSLEEAVPAAVPSSGYLNEPTCEVMSRPFVATFSEFFFCLSPPPTSAFWRRWPR